MPEGTWRLRTAVAISLASGLFIHEPSVNAGPSFQGVGDLPGGAYYSRPTSVSHDGSVVVGWSASILQSSEAFRWTAEGGMIGLGGVPGGTSRSSAWDTSEGGSVIVGQSFVRPEPGELWRRIPVRWTATDGMVELGELPSWAFNSMAFGVSGDGSVIVGGFGTTARLEAFRWTGEDGIVSIGVGLAVDVSADGAVIAGYSLLGGPFRWTAEAGMVNLGSIGNYIDTAAISADGAVLVGSYRSGSMTMRGWRWTEQTGLVSLAGSAVGNRPWAVSGDGSVIVGGWTGPGEAFIWDEESGLRSLQDTLVTEYELDLTGWSLVSAEGISTDGLTIVGYGTNPSGQGEGWIAQLPSSFPDCNDNDILDACDIDCGTPGGQCDVAGCGESEDCNDNNIPDECDISDGMSSDCNSNRIPDECDLADCDGSPWCRDCNDNATLDECDIADGTSPDDNGNGVPDECEISAHLDIKPGSCPNPVNPRSKGVVPMAIIGGDTFDVTQIDIGTLKLRRADGIGGIVTPLSGPPGPGITTDDVATPFTGDLCDCHELGGDGIDDLLLKLSTRELAGAFDLSELPSGASMMLTLSGLLLDGTSFEASDCVVIPGKPARSRQRGSRKRE